MKLGILSECVYVAAMTRRIMKHLFSRTAHQLLTNFYTILAQTRCLHRGERNV